MRHFYLVGADFKRFAFASLRSTSNVEYCMSYIFKSFPNPLTMVASLANTVNNRLSNIRLVAPKFSTIRHLFPGMNSDYYPNVSHLLTQHYGNRYNRISFRDAWNQLWKIQLYESADLESDVNAAPLSET
jgi:hypothetical protein